MRFLATQWRVAAIVVLIAASLASAPSRPYSTREKAFFADDPTVQFVRPGLVIKVNSAQIAGDGTITAVYTVSDPAGLPLDTTGVTTPGTISLSFIAAVLPNAQEQYTSYTTRTATGTVLATTQQAGADSGGTSTQVGPGQYQYTFHTRAPSGFDATATHTIGIYGSRNLTIFNLGTNYASTTFNFVPNGAAVTHTHDIIKTASCNACHDQLSAHGGSRRGMDMCVLVPHAAEPPTPTPATRWTPRFSSTRSTWARICRASWPALPIFPLSTSSGRSISRTWLTRPIRAIRGAAKPAIRKPPARRKPPLI